MSTDQDTKPEPSPPIAQTFEERMRRKLAEDSADFHNQRMEADRERSKASYRQRWITALVAVGSAGLAIGATLLIGKLRGSNITSTTTVTRSVRVS